MTLNPQTRPLARDAVETRVRALLAQMTLAEKAGQMAQIEKNSITPAQVRDYAVGSVLSGGGGNPTPNTPQAWAQMVRTFQEAALQSRLGIPILYGSDAVHGHNNVRGATIFPHNIGLGATRDADLVRRTTQVTAREALATNVQWAFAPAVSVPRDVRWGRTYEGFSDNTELVTRLGVAALEGLQNSERFVLASVKHYLADGGTTWGSTRHYDWIPGWWKSADPQRWQIDQGDSRVDEATLRAVHLAPYVAAIAAGARNIMVSYSSWHGLKMHAHHMLLTEVLKDELGFDGFLVSDWLGAGQLDSDFEQSLILTINAGMDMVMVPFECAGFVTAVMHAVERGAIPLSRIDDAVTRILRVKVEMGLFEQPFGDESLLQAVGSPEHRAVAREAVRKSLVLLKNHRSALPLPRQAARVLVAGDAADNIGLQCGGWTIEWQGVSGDITPGTTLLAALRQALPAPTDVIYSPDAAFAPDQPAEVGIVVLSEPPYAEGEGDRSDLSLPSQAVALVQRMRSQCDRLVVVLYSGRPLWTDDVLSLCDAFVAAWLPGTEGQGIVDVLVGDAPFTGKLPMPWAHHPTQAQADPFPFGYGLSL